jgi:ammonia channel protein AmtB
VGRLVWVQWRVGPGGEFARRDGNHRDPSGGLCRLTWGAIEWTIRRKPSVLGMISGAVAGLGTITPASGFVAPWHGIVIGVIAGSMCFWACTSLKHRFNYDDSLDVFGVHGVGGMTGIMLAGVFATASIGGTSGLIEGNAGLLLIQLCGVLVTLAWSGGVTYLLLKLVSAFVPLRVSREHEREGPRYFAARRGLAVDSPSKYRFPALAMSMIMSRESVMPSFWAAMIRL